MKLMLFWLLPITSLALRPLSVLDRRQILAIGNGMATASIISQRALSFEGGVGGLGKTKPETGVVFRDGSIPIQNKLGIISAEIISGRGNPIVVQFTAPYPLLPTSNGLEARDLQQSESAFVHVISGVAPDTSQKSLLEVLNREVFGSRGKYGAYGSPTDIKFSSLRQPNDANTTASTIIPNKNILYQVTFTTLTPGMRESERKIFINCQWCDNETLVMLLVGTTRIRFSSQARILTEILNSFLAFDAPRTELRTVNEQTKRS
jgi:hypothetical protein